MGIDRYRAMEVFNKVVELGSFTGAAVALDLPKDRVAALAQELETHLGVKLLDRATRRLGLTDDGIVYHRRALDMVQEMDEMEGTLRRAVATPAGRLRIDVPASVGSHMIAPALPDFFKRFPDMVLELGSTDRPVDLLAEGVDCVIRGGQLQDDTLVARQLGNFPTVTCAAPGYLKKYGTPKTLHDLADQLWPRPTQREAGKREGRGHRFVNFHSPKTGDVLPLDFVREEEVVQMHRPHWVSCSNADSHLAAVVAGMGVAQVALTRRVCDLLASGQLVRVLQEWTPAALPMMVLYPRKRHLTPRVRVFADWVGEIFAAEFAASTRLYPAG